MIVKKHVKEGKLVLAICDEDLLNKKIEEKDIILDLSSYFYKGDKITEDLLLTLIKKAYMINAVGSNIINLLIKQELINETDIKKIKDIPYVHVVFEG